MNAGGDASGRVRSERSETHTGLIIASAACATLGALLIGGYAWRHGAPLLGGVGLQLLLAAISVVATYRATVIRKRFLSAWNADENEQQKQYHSDLALIWLTDFTRVRCIRALVSSSEPLRPVAIQR